MNHQFLVFLGQDFMLQVEKFQKRVVTERDHIDVKRIGYLLIGPLAGYNLQSVVDEKHRLIVNSDVASENNDLNQFAQQIKKANKILEKKCDVACADCVLDLSVCL